MANDLVTRLSLDDSNFSSGISSAVGSLNKLDKQATLTSRGLDNFFKGKGVDEMKSSFDGVEKVLNNLEKKMGSAGTGMKQQLRAMTVAAQELEQTYRNLSAAEQQSGAGQELRAHIDELISKAGELKDTMGDVQGAISFAASDTAQLQAFSQGLSALSASAQVATGAMSLFGVSEEKAAAIQQTIVTLIGITNGLQVIQNALQKESNLMQFISIARNQGLAVALGLRTAATAAATTAEEAETVAVEANTAAWAMNPIGAIVIAVAAAAAGIYALVDALSAATAEEERAAELAEKFNQELDNQMTNVADNIMTFEDLQDEYNACGGNTQKLTQFIHKNKEKFKALGVEVKNVDQVHKIFGNNSKAYIQASIQRAQQMAMEAANAAMLAETLSALSKVQAALIRGEEVNWGDYAKAIQKATGWDFKKANDVMVAAGLQSQADFLGKADVVAKEGVELAEANAKIMNQVIERAVDLSKQSMEALQAEFKKSTPAVQEMKGELDHYQESSDAGASSTNGHTQATKAHTQATKKDADAQKNARGEIELTDDQVKNLVNSYEGCTKIIQAADKQIKSLDKTSKTYNEDLKRLTDLMISATEKKLTFYDENNSEGLEEALKDINTIIKLLPYGTEEWKQWILKGEEYNKKLKDIKQQQEDIVKGIEKGSETELDRRISEKKTLQKNSASLAFRAGIQLEIDDLEQQKKDLQVASGEKGWNIELPVKIDPTFDYKKTEVEKLQEQLNHLSNRKDYLEGLKKEAPSWELENINKELDELKEKIPDLEKKLKKAELFEDFKEYKKNVMELKESLVKDSITGLRGLYDAFSKLSNPMENAKNGFEAFLNVLDSAVSIYDTVKGIINIIKEIATATGLLNAVETLLTGTKETKNALTEQEIQQSTQLAANKATEAAAQVTLASTSPGVVAALESQAAAAGTALAPLKELTGTMLELAAATMFSANASIPIVGAAIGAANVAIMTATMATVKALATASQFANGGIVGGSSYHGDKIYARVNSGEMLLNKKQQSNLFRLLDGGHSAAASGNVEFKLKGQELVGCIKNYNDKKSKLR